MPVLVDHVTLAGGGRDSPPDRDRLTTAGEEWDAAVRRSHERGIALAGTPIIAVDGGAVFGPVLSHVPRGESAGRLWDAKVTVANTPGFHELNHAKPER